MKSSSLSASYDNDQALDLVCDGVIGLNCYGNIVYLNQAAARLLSVNAEDALGQALEKIATLEVDRVRSRRLNRMGEDQESRFHPDAKAMVLIGSCRRRPIDLLEIKQPSGSSRGEKLLILHDLSRETELQQSITEQARNDKLTGLLNRYELDRCLGNLIEDAETSGQTHALLYIDLDQFKVVNDTCGHQAGDELLRMLGMHLKKAVQHGDIVGRLGGDEFAVLLCQVDPEDALEVAQRICKTINAIRFAWGSYSFAVKASIGATMLTEHTRTSSVAMRQADSACYAAKDQGRNRVHLFTESDRQLVHRRGEMQWLSQINQALDEDRLCIVKQRIAPLQANGCTEMAEVLVRMQMADGKEIAPGAFIPAAERYNLMPAIDRWVIRRTLQTLACIPRDADPIERYTVNLSGLSIGDPSFLNFILQEFESSGVSPTRICFEVTETAAVASFSRAVRFMSLLREVGCQFALDDFGSGMSSFGYLRELPVDYLKIDGMFVADLDVDPFHRAIVRSITEVDHAAGKKTIAEHVDSEANLKLLRDMGVDYVQGFFIERPAPFLLLNAA
ncbi:MAG: putative bifunctional diguanylate cyclase/phosphodiesterase [Oceanococcus sp.]